ncbi:MAG TPA: hypothetical protein VGO00_17650 [Kofleriaceae bacterium]|nr:hypothetical protein [Kofleriaceae bacterium]
MSEIQPGAADSRVMQSTLRILIAAAIVANTAGCATDDPEESQTEQGLSGLIYEGDFIHSWECEPGSLDDPNGPTFQPFVYPIGIEYGCTSYSTFSFCGIVYDESQITSAWYDIQDYQGNQYCTGNNHYRIWKNFW